MIFWFSFLVSLINWGVFYQLILCPVFFFSFFIIGLEDFSPATWLFETHQLPYEVRIFSVVSRFSSPVFLIGLRGFSPGFYSPSIILRSAELASKEEGNGNNVTFRGESFWSGSYVTIIIQIVTLVSLTSTTMSHQVKLLFGATIFSHFTHSTAYLTPYCLCS